jgi:hypothetical protein
MRVGDNEEVPVKRQWKLNRFPTVFFLYLLLSIYVILNYRFSSLSLHLIFLAILYTLLYFHTHTKPTFSHSIVKQQ